MAFMVARAECHIVGILVFEDFRIADVTADVGRIIVGRHQEFFFGEMCSVLTCEMDSVTSASGVDIIVVRAVEVFYISGVEIVDRSVLAESGAGVDTVCVKVVIRKEYRAVILIMNEIAGCTVIPQFEFAGRLKRGVLKVDVVHAVCLNKSVRIVEPSGFRHQVKMESAGIFADELAKICFFLIPLLVVFSGHFVVFFKFHKSSFGHTDVSAP